MSQVLPQLVVDADILAEIQAAVATGKHVIISQQAVTVAQWSGGGYIIRDPDTGAGAYQISGGANGGWLIATFASLALFLAFLPLALAFASALAPTVVFLLGSVIALRVAALAVIVSSIFLQARKLPEGSRPRGYLAHFAYGAIGLGLAEILGVGGIRLPLADAAQP